MPKIGEIKRGKEIGKTGPSDIYIWCSCARCGLVRWVRLTYGKPRTKVCASCTGKIHGGIYAKAHLGPANANWKGGRRINTDGYIVIRPEVNDPFYKMRNKDGYILEHRYIMARHLGRILPPEEEIHHINGDRTDNRIGNLKLVHKSEHPASYIAGYRAGYQAGCRETKGENGDIVTPN